MLSADESKVCCSCGTTTMKLIQPNTRHLKRALAEAARGIATQLASAGHRGWIVGGAVRDLALGSKVAEIDMATDALPAEVEALFEVTIPVGKAFGTVIVMWKGLPVEVTTFRSESGYSDGRRPDEVEFGASVEEDARRRDFTCNALFLDPLTEELRDPEDGLEDLGAGCLVAIGDEALRFREDGLRLMRLARFHARLGLEVVPETLAAARAEAASIEKVSRERMLQELLRMLTARRAHVALGLLVELGVLERALQAWAELQPGPESIQRRLETLEWLESTHAPSGLAVLFDPLGGDPAAALVALEQLKPSKELQREVAALWKLLDALEALWPLEESNTRCGPDRSARLRILAHPLWPRVRDLAAAFGDARGVTSDGEHFEGGHLGRMARELDAFSHGLEAADIEPAPLLTSASLAKLGSQPGPHWSRLLDEAYELQLQSKLADEAAAEAWLVAELSSAE